MKFIHTADIHLDSKIDGLSAQKSKIRREEILITFENMVNYAVLNGVRAIIISGDAFDSKKITIKTISRVREVIIQNPQLDFLYLPGNHDGDSFISSLEDIPKNLKVFGDSWTKFSYENVDVWGMVVNEINNSTFYENLNLDQDKINIVCLHGQVVGFKSNIVSELISIPKLKNKNIDYLALGHIHSYSFGTIDERGVYAYSGCLEGRGFDETGDKGFSLLNVADNKISSEFVKFSKRNLYEHEFDVSQYSSWVSARTQIITELESKYPSTSLIKLVLKGERDTAFDIDIEGLNILLNNKFFFAKIYDKTELKVNIEDYLYDKTVRGEFVRAVWESDMDELMKRRVIMCGINALKGEEI